MPETITGPSGKTYQWTQPPRHVHWRHGRAAQTFQNKVNEIVGESPDMPDDEKGLRLMEAMSAGEAAALERYVNDVLKSGLGYEPTPDRVPEIDYWFFYGISVYAVKGAKVETTEGVTDVETLDNFRQEPGVSEAGEDVPDVRRKCIGEDGDSRPAAV